MSRLIPLFIAFLLLLVPPSRIAAADLWTGWLTDGDGPGEYHDRYLSMAKLGFYPAFVEGRAAGDHDQYRAIFLPYPEKPYACYSFHGLDVEGYLEAVQEVAGMGYDLVTWHYFFDHNEEIRFQVTWLKTRDSFRSNPTWLDRSGQRRELDLRNYPDLQR